MDYYIIRKSKPELKPIAFFIFLSYGMIALGVVFTYPATKSVIAAPLFTGALFFILACFIVILPLFIEKEWLSKSLNYYTITLVTTIFSGILAIFVFIQSRWAFIPKIITIVATIIVLLFLILSYLTLRNGFQFPEKSEVQDFLSVFTRPKKVTEEEVSVSKEKKICLVCKGNVFRNNIYLCPECNTFYCSKCSEALSNLENACWVCETPFDESKPVRLPEKKEEEMALEISEKSKKME